jgi:uncharacterized protein (UPF0335 family)
MNDAPATRLAKDHLKAFVERIERLEEEKKGIAEDIKSVYGEAKANGFDVKALRAIVKLRKLSPEDRAENAAILETYMAALGMLPGDGGEDDALERRRSDRGKAHAARAQACAMRADVLRSPLHHASDNDAVSGHGDRGSARGALGLTDSTTRAGPTSPSQKNSPGGRSSSPGRAHDGDPQARLARHRRTAPPAASGGAAASPLRRGIRRDETQARPINRRSGGPDQLAGRPP